MDQSPARFPLRAVGTAASALLLLVAACSGAVGGPVSSGPSAPMPATSAAATGAPGTTAGASATAIEAPTAPGIALTQTWATAELTDVRNGNAFRIADLVAADHVVFIETMAIWCSKCRAQQRDAVIALADLDPDRVTWISVDVDGSESAADLAAYSRLLGFDWPHVVGSNDLLRALADEFGTQVLSPPSTPIIVVGTDGTVTLTEFGPKTVDRIVELAAAHGA